jgi:hypothetical protein
VLSGPHWFVMIMMSLKSAGLTDFLLQTLEMKQKNIFIFKKKFQNGRLKKTEFFNSVNSQYLFSKISWIGLWVSRID